MLSVKKISLEQSSTYYTKDNYYTKQIGEFYGKAKDDLQLSDLTHESFQSLLKGINPITGEALVASKTNKVKNLPAVDFTFSAPKSISVLYEIAAASNDKELSLKIQEAHDKSVNSALNLVEKNHIKTRVQKDKVRKSVNTNYLLAAKFQHDTSRDLDPQLHTHCVVMNFTKNDEKYKSLDLQNLLKKDSPIIKNIGQYYRFKLKEELEKLGFKTEFENKKEVFFELKNIDKELLTTFSNRRVAIEIAAAKLKKKFPNMSHNELYQKATLQSRKSKKEVNRDDVFKSNLKIANSIVDTKQLLKKFQPQKVVNKSVLKLDDKAISKVIKKAHKDIKKEIKNTTKKRETKNNRIKRHSTVENISIKAASISSSKKTNISIDDIRSRVEKATKNKETVKVFQNMNSIVKRELNFTKLNTAKLFSTIEKLKRINENKLIKEEIKENAKRRGPAYDTKLIKRYDREAISAIRDDVKKSRDIINIGGDINSKYRKRTTKRGVEFKRLDDDSNRYVGKIDRKDRRGGINEVVVTKEDLKELNNYVKNLEKEKKKNQEI